MASGLLSLNNRFYCILQNRKSKTCFEGGVCPYVAFCGSFWNCPFSRCFHVTLQSIWIQIKRIRGRRLADWKLISLKNGVLESTYKLKRASKFCSGLAETLRCHVTSRGLHVCPVAGATPFSEGPVFGPPVIEGSQWVAWKQLERRLVEVRLLFHRPSAIVRHHHSRSSHFSSRSQCCDWNPRKGQLDFKKLCQWNQGRVTHEGFAR